MFSGHEKYLTMNRERQPVPKCRCWMGPGTPTASSSEIFVLAQLRIVTHRGPSGTASRPHGRHLSEGGGDRWEERGIGKEQGDQQERKEGAGRAPVVSTAGWGREAHGGGWAVPEGTKESEDCSLRCDFIILLCLKTTGRAEGVSQEVMCLLRKQRRLGSNQL